jgi:hypothetical protein
MVVIESMANYELSIRHVFFFGTVGPYNDINLLQLSPIYARLVEGPGPPCNNEINGHPYISKGTT